MLADRYIAHVRPGEIDRLDVAYTQFINAARQEAIVADAAADDRRAGRRGRPVGPPGEAGRRGRGRRSREASASPTSSCPTPQSILEEIVPVSFKVRLFKCFLDAAVSEQIARMVAMRGATENADDMVKSLTRHVQPRPAGPDHPRAGRDHRRRPRPSNDADDVQSDESSAISTAIADCDPSSRDQRSTQRDASRHPTTRDSRIMATATATGRDRPGDRLDVRRRVRRGAPARDLQRPDDRRPRTRASRST